MLQYLWSSSDELIIHLPLSVAILPLISRALRGPALLTGLSAPLPLLDPKLHSAPDPLSLSLRLFGGSWFRCLGYRVEIREASQQWAGKHDQYRHCLYGPVVSHSVAAATAEALDQSQCASDARDSTETKSVEKGALSVPW
ncbi:hypothetical protein AOLI_G00179560 [Acnodon oligacanthus]